MLAQLDAIETLKTIARASPIEVRESKWPTDASAPLIALLTRITASNASSSEVDAAAQGSFSVEPEYFSLVAPAVEVLTEVAKIGKRGQASASQACAPLVALLRAPLPGSTKGHSGSEADSDGGAASAAAQQPPTMHGVEQPEGDEDGATYAILVCVVRALIALCTKHRDESGAQAVVVENQRAVRDGGGVPLMVELLERSPPLSALAAECLAALASDKDACDAIYEARGLGRLIKLLEDPTPRVAAEAAHALKAVAFRSAVDRDTIREENGIPALVSLLARSLARQTHPPGVPRELALPAARAEQAMWAAGALRHLAYTNVQNCDAIREAGAISPLLELLQLTVMRQLQPSSAANEPPTAAKAEEEALIDACGCLWNLTEHSAANCFALLDSDGGVASLIALLAREQHAYQTGAENVPGEPLWRLCENALINLIEKSAAPTQAQQQRGSRRRRRRRLPRCQAGATPPRPPRPARAAGGGGWQTLRRVGAAEAPAHLPPAPKVAAPSM